MSYSSSPLLDLASLATSSSATSSSESAIASCSSTSSSKIYASKSKQFSRLDQISHWIPECGLDEEAASAFDD
uniref:Uncharacterized protein n=1 Tax=Tanacetum cinerariifolium TaxID=118510 RepID=A0A699JS18_TANCI|nr:hypothetical protein [Tanacetum cinerariifolium]